MALFVTGLAWAAGEHHPGGAPDGKTWPVYQRKSHFAGPVHGGRHDGGYRHVPPNVSAGWFQRPYPYHLDYYRMRYGGSYAPYFGNLYGPPNVYVAPPYYGDYAPYYGGPYNGAVGYPGFNGYLHNGEPPAFDCVGPNCAGGEAIDVLPAP